MNFYFNHEKFNILQPSVVRQVTPIKVKLGIFMMQAMRTAKNNGSSIYSLFTKAQKTNFICVIILLKFLQNNGSKLQTM